MTYLENITMNTNEYLYSLAPDELIEAVKVSHRKVTITHYANDVKKLRDDAINAINRTMILLDIDVKELTEKMIR